MLVKESKAAVGHCSKLLSKNRLENRPPKFQAIAKAIIPSVSMKQNRAFWAGIFLPTALLIFFLALRLPALGRFVTTDEALWLRRSANFYLAISNGEWEKTYQSPHPGVVTMWAGAAGFRAAFPEYGRAGSDFIHDEQLLTIMENRGINPMEVLAAGRLVLVIVHAAAFIAAWPFARRLLGPPAAALGMALLALDPFVTAHQRLLHLDGILASFMLLAVLAYLDHLRERRWTSLLVSAIATGLAWLTKTPSWFLLPAILAITIYFWVANRKKQLPITTYYLPITFLCWFAISLLVVFLLFPALWTDPIDIPSQMASYALGSAEGEYSGPVFFNGAVYPEGDLGAAGWVFYPLVLLWRSTPLVLIGLAFALWFSLTGLTTGRTQSSSTSRLSDLHTLRLLLLFSLAFILFMTIAGKKFDRYLLPALPPVILIAGWGWAQLATRIKWFQHKQWRTAPLLVAVGALQLASALPTFPYYLNYYDPLMGGSTKAPEVMMVGWGEGLDQAAEYLNQKGLQPGEAAAWYSVSFNLMASAEVADIPVELELSESELSDLLAKQYLVVYVHQWQRGTPQNLLDALQGMLPEYRIVINGIEYVRIYHLLGQD
jgi:hypothetical protein